MSSHSAAVSRNKVRFALFLMDTLIHVHVRAMKVYLNKRIPSESHLCPSLLISHDEGMFIRKT